MRIEKMYDWYQYSRKKQDYTLRIDELNKELNHLENELNSLIDEVARFMKIYNTDIRLARINNYDASGFFGVWFFDGLKRQCINAQKKKNTYSVRIRNFGRMKTAESDVKKLLQSKDDTFLSEFVVFEKKRVSLNLAIRSIANMIDNLEKLSQNDFSLTKLIEEIK